MYFSLTKSTKQATGRHANRNHTNNQYNIVMDETHSVRHNFYCETDLYLQTSTVDKIVYSDKDYKKSGINVGDSARYVSRPH